MLTKNVPVTLHLPAEQIPAGSQVRRPHGTSKYYLKRKIEAYSQDGRIQPWVLETGMLVLHGETSINIISKSTVLALDFDTLDAAHEFLGELITRVEEAHSQ